MTIDRCLCAHLGPVDPSLVAQLIARGFDQAPVAVPGCGIGWALVPTGLLEELAGRREPLLAEHLGGELDDTLTLGNSPYFAITLDDLLDAMSGRRAAIVYDGEGDGGTILGLLTLADFNKDAVRPPAYCVLLDLEIALADLVDRSYRDPWDWICRLSEYHQVNILGAWDLVKRKGMDVGAVTVAGLTELLQVVGHSPELLRSLGISSRREFNSSVREAVQLRNCIMHPVRPFILDDDDVRRRRDALRFAADLRERVRRVLQDT